MEKYIPQLFIVPSPEAEVLGQAMLGFVEGLRESPFKFIIEANDLSHIEGDKWYPMQSALNLFKALYEDPHGPNYDLVVVGMKAMGSLSLLSQADSIEEALRAVDYISRSFARNVPEDFGFLLEMRGEGHALVTNNTPVPDSGLYGLLWNIVNSSKAPDEIYLVRALDAHPGMPTVFEIKWGFEEDGLTE